ncbi:DUF2956 family protein [Thalassotalea crassostreae]|uniref:DUF2956 family protein n=1 Tax=Thalassotalea crassostreae TaxID=1763536 RepID=UPI000838F2EB|nr:DUF2956 family protein [Thalassotalea crassostreae]
MDAAAAVAASIKKPGQNKEQTKLISQGIQKGIELYKKQQKEKARSANKEKKKMQKAKQQLVESEHDNVQVKNNRLPWVLLSLSWLLFIVYVSVN